MQIAKGIKSEEEALKAMPLQGLKKEWRRLLRSVPPPGLSRDLMIRAITFKLQEQLHGGLSQSNKRKLRTLTKRLKDIDRGQTPPPTLKPGTTLVRDWRGRRHTVTVSKDGFTYAGEEFKSLSVIARTITGTRWSGPRFFGLKSLVSKSNEETPNYV